MLYVFNSFGNMRKLQVIIYQGSQQDTQPNDADFSSNIVSSFDLSVCANTLNLESGHIMLHHPSDLISSTMHILPMFTEFNVIDRPNSENMKIELTVRLLKSRIDKVNYISLIAFIPYRVKQINVFNF
jgi:hypothetical protein